MFKKFARWILANEINEAEIKLDMAKAQVNDLQSMVNDMHADYIRAEGVISQAFYATQGIKQGTAMKVNRIVSQYYDAS